MLSDTQVGGFLSRSPKNLSLGCSEVLLKTQGGLSQSSFTGIEIKGILMSALVTSSLLSTLYICRQFSDSPIANKILNSKENPTLNQITT